MRLRTEQSRVDRSYSGAWASRFADKAAQFLVDEVLSVGWERFGALGGYAPRLLGSVVRLLWLALHPQSTK